MEITILEHVEFSDSKAEDVTLIANVCHYPQDCTFLEGIDWDKDQYSASENNIISEVANRQSIIDRIFDKYNEQVQERLIENY